MGRTLCSVVNKRAPAAGALGRGIRQARKTTGLRTGPLALPPTASLRPVARRHPFAGAPTRPACLPCLRWARTSLLAPPASSRPPSELSSVVGSVRRCSRAPHAVPPATNCRSRAPPRAPPLRHPPLPRSRVYLAMGSSLLESWFLKFAMPDLVAKRDPYACERARTLRGRAAARAAAGPERAPAAASPRLTAPRAPAPAPRLPQAPAASSASAPCCRLCVLRSSPLR